MVSDFRKKRNAFLSGTSKVILGILIFAVLVSLFIASTKIYKKGEKFTFQIENLKSEIQDLRVRNNYLREAISQNNDADYIEKVAREELNLQKPGEQAISFVEELPKKENQEVQSDFWQYWMGWLSNIFKR